MFTHELFLSVRVKPHNSQAWRLIFSGNNDELLRFSFFAHP